MHDKSPGGADERGYPDQSLSITAADCCTIRDEGGAA